MNGEKIDIISTQIVQNKELLDEHTIKFEQVNKTLEDHTKTLDKHTEILDKHTKILDEHTEDFKSIKRTLAIIEDAVTNKIPALFDANQANQEKHEEFDNRIVDIENISANNSLKISILEDTSRIHSKQLSKLLS